MVLTLTLTLLVFVCVPSLRIRIPVTKYSGTRGTPAIGYRVPGYADLTEWYQFPWHEQQMNV